MFQLCEAETTLSFIMMKHEMPDNLINMCCISFSALTLVGRKGRPLFGASWLTGSDCSGTVRDTHLLERGNARRRIPFWSRLADGSPGERQMGIILGPDDKRPILMSLFSHCGASLSSQNLLEQPGKTASYPPSHHPVIELTWRLRAKRNLIERWLQQICS